MVERLLIGALCLGMARLALAAEPLPPVSPEARAAAFPELAVTDEHDAHAGEPLYGMFLAEQFEWQDRDGGDALKWDVTGWLGYETSRVWLRDEGDHVSGEQVENQLELLWGRPVAAWWDLVAGVRHDTGAGPSRTYAALGVQGLAPQWFHVEATLYAGERGQAGLRLQSDYEWLLTNRFILTARLEGHAWREDDEANGLGSGLAEVSAGLRARYEIRREFAPYVGVEWMRLAADTADLARASGEDVRDTRIVAGVRFWF